MADYLKAIYIIEMLETPFNFPKHEQLFNSVILSEFLKSEDQNNYMHVITPALKSFYASQSGKQAFAFSALKPTGESFNLQELDGKIIFIDVWATWCGPCIEHRPKVIELAEKYKNTDEVEAIMLSVDSSKDKWLNFLQKEKETGMNLFIKNGMQTEFGKYYNIKTIPRYILIDKNGIIVNSDFEEPGIETEEAIKKLLIEE